MSLGLRLSLLPLVIAGCASQLLVVPDADWQKVPPAKRDTVDRQVAADLAAARTELTAASAGLAAGQRSQPAPVAATPAPTAPRAPKPAAHGDEWTAALRTHEQAGVGAKAQIEAARTAWQRADRSWRQLRFEAASARIDVIVCQRELVRAQTIDHNLVGTDTYDIAPLRGQFSRAQQRWHSVASAARQARSLLEQASATLTSAKEAYAQLMRDGPLPSSTQPSVAAAEDRPPPLQLTGGAVARSDLHHRRGLRHFLDAGASAQLHGVAIQLDTGRSTQAIALGMTPLPASGPEGNGKPAVEVPQGNSATTVAPATKPADHPAPPANAAAGLASNGKPAGAPQGNAAVTASPAVARPADRPASPLPPAGGASSTGKPPAEASRGNPPAAAVKPADRPLLSTAPAASASSNTKPPAEVPRASAPTAPMPPANGVPGNGKAPTEAPRGNPPAPAAKPADRPLFPTSPGPGPSSNGNHP